MKLYMASKNPCKQLVVPMVLVQGIQYGWLKTWSTKYMMQLISHENIAMSVMKSTPTCSQ
jgi:hypothetical protein